VFAAGGKRVEGTWGGVRDGMCKEGGGDTFAAGIGARIIDEDSMA
jgi:hypothetical protein